MTCREWLNVLAILESIDEVPGMPPAVYGWPRDWGVEDRVQLANLRFRDSPISFLRRADDATRDAIWAEVERRLAAMPVKVE